MGRGPGELLRFAACLYLMVSKWRADFTALSRVVAFFGQKEGATTFSLKVSTTPDPGLSAVGSLLRASIAVRIVLED